KLALTTAPSSSAASGAALTQQPVLQIQDASGNPVSQSGTQVTATIASGPAGATLSGATATTGAGGAATFSGLAISGPTGSYTLSFGATGLTAATSGAITLGAGTASQLVFSVQPSNTTAGAAITPAVQVTARDGQGNTATGFTGNVTVAIGANPSGGTLAGRPTGPTANGRARGPGVSSVRPGTRKRKVRRSTGWSDP